MKNSGCPRAKEKTQTTDREAVINKGKQHSQSRKISSKAWFSYSFAGWGDRWALDTQRGMLRLAHLIHARLSATPVQQHLLDGVCVGHAKAGGALHPVYFGHGLISRTKRKVSCVVNSSMFWPAAFLPLVALPLSASLPSSLLLQLLYHGFSSLRGWCFRQGLGSHQFLAPLGLPSLYSAAATSSGRVIFAIKHTEVVTSGQFSLWKTCYSLSC